jgi:hypothetical protein
MFSFTISLYFFLLFTLRSPATKIAFYVKGGSKGPLDAAKAMEMILDVMGDASEAKTAAIAEIVKGVEFSIVTSASDVTNL